MQKKYKVKVTRRAWIEVTCDESLTQDEVYQLAKEKVSKGKTKWEEPSFNIISISIDSDVNNVETKVTNMKAEDPLLS